ncbi:MAG TPA: hypothetical protein VGE74_08095 [Gemmata sp.]
MRPALAFAVLLGTVVLVQAQVPKDPPPRYGVPSRVRVSPQTNPKETLKTALALIDAGQYAYLVAHVLDPKFVDEAVADRAKGFEATVGRELAQLRDFQRANPDRVQPEDRVPLDPKAFRAVVADKARTLAFQQLQKDIEEKMRESPQTLKDLRKILREGTFSEADPTASAAHDAIKGRTLYFKKVGDRWFLENKVAQEPQKEP